MDSSARFIRLEETVGFASAPALRLNSQALPTPFELAEKALQKTEFLAMDAVKAWQTVFQTCHEGEKDFGSLLSLHARFGRSFLECILDSKDVSSCSFVHALLPSGEYAGGEIIRTETLLVTREGEDKRSRGYQKLPRNGYYVGGFLNGLADGFGTSDVNCGSVYEGEFQNSRYHGYGKITSKVNQANSYEGIFIEEKYIGNPRSKKTIQFPTSSSHVSYFFGK